MLQSENRILTTHAGSLPRPQELTEMLSRLSRHEPVDPVSLREAALDATRHAIRKQLEVGIDVGNDGEQARESFFTYVQHRMSGFSGRSERPVMQDIIRYPGFAKLKLGSFPPRDSVDLLHAPKATGEVRYLDRSAIDNECADYLKILGEQRKRFAESFMTAPSPGIIAAAMLNEHYPSLGEYLAALGAALKTEYEAIVSHGLVLQIDCPDLAMEAHTSFARRPLGAFRRFVGSVVSVINQALENVPRDRVRMHVCWGNYEGPHDLDVPLEAILPVLYRANVGALMISMANPRHAHEYHCFERLPLPHGTLLIVGVIDTTTNYVEHPEVVAERLERVARVIGDPRRVLAGTDCGFGTAAGFGEVAEEVVWEKLRAMVQGAALASKRLFG